MFLLGFEGLRVSLTLIPLKTEMSTWSVTAFDCGYQNTSESLDHKPATLLMKKDCLALKETFVIEHQTPATTNLDQKLGWFAAEIIALKLYWKGSNVEQAY